MDTLDSIKAKLTQADGSSQVNGKWQYIADGQVCKNGWRNINEKWYLFDTISKMLTGWQLKDDKWYYLSVPDGEMVTGTKVD